ncbi:MAG: hypothetical protein ACRBDI_04375 [Alphaproteobacteria bacterium]
MGHTKTALLGLFGAIAIPAAITAKIVDFDTNTLMEAAKTLAGSMQETKTLIEQEPQKQKALQRYEELSQ